MNKDYMVNDIKNEMKACIDNMTLSLIHISEPTRRPG